VPFLSCSGKGRFRVLSTLRHPAPSQLSELWQGDGTGLVELPKLRQQARCDDVFRHLTAAGNWKAEPTSFPPEAHAVERGFRIRVMLRAMPESP
jgi:hypothetical protein